LNLTPALAERENPYFWTDTRKFAMTSSCLNIGKSERMIISKDNIRNKVTYFPSKSKTNPLVICIPAMGVTAKFYDAFAQKLSEHGMNAITADLRGNGCSEIRASRGTNFGYHDMIANDWPAIVAAATDKFPGCPVFLLGHSLGGQLNALYTSLNPDQINGLILVASGSVHYKGWPFPLNIGLLLGTQMARTLAAIYGYFPGKQVGFGGREARTVIRDWAHTALTGRFEPVGSMFDFEMALKEVRAHILAITFDGDRFATKRSAKNLYSKMTPTTVRHIHMGRREMAPSGLHHFKWTQSSQPIVACIHRWIRYIPYSAPG